MFESRALITAGIKIVFNPHLQSHRHWWMTPRESWIFTGLGWSTLDGVCPPGVIGAFKHGPSSTPEWLTQVPIWYSWGSCIYLILHLSRIDFYNCLGEDYFFFTVLKVLNILYFDQLNVQTGAWIQSDYKTKKLCHISRTIHLIYLTLGRSVAEDPGKRSIMQICCDLDTFNIDTFWTHSEELLHTGSALQARSSRCRTFKILTVLAGFLLVS